MDTITKVDGWGFAHSGAFTDVFNPDGNKITTFFRHLDAEDVRSFKAGYEMGVIRGIEEGCEAEQQRIRNLLGL